MNSKNIEYTDGKTQFIGQLYWDATVTGKRPGIVVFPDAFGLGEHARQRAQQLAQMGYIALAADLHGDGKLFTDRASLGASIQALYADRLDWRARARAALDVLAAQALVESNKIAAIGFCFGGSTCLELARSGAPLVAIVTFHAGLIAELPEDSGHLHAKVLICHGAEDPVVQQEGIDAVMSEFRRDHIDWQFIYYGNTKHAFTDIDADKHAIPGLAYNACTDKRAWTAMRNLFDEVFN